MNIFSKIEGLSGENFGSALLSYLILNSHEIRDAFLILLSDKSPIGPISSTSHFSCRTEYPTIDEGGNGGRLDILIQLDNVVIGIENKFFASFQDGQPFKYMSTIQSVAGALTTINHSEVKALLYVLCPESRKKEALSKIHDRQNVGVITWEEILNILKSISVVSNPVTKVIMDEFAAYLKRHFSFIHDFERKAPHMRKHFPTYGSSVQAELVKKLWSLFPDSGPRLSNGQGWLGYYFYTSPATNEKGWFGFVPSKELDYKTHNHAELIVATTYLTFPGGNLKPTRILNDLFIGAPGRTHTWVIDFDRSWNSIDVWRDQLLPFWEVVHTDVKDTLMSVPG